MSETLKVAIIQANLVWENPIQNRINFTEKIEGIADEVDLIVLPEMFTSGFTMQPKHVAEPMNGETITWLQQLAAKKQAAIMGSLVIEDNNTFYNRLVFIRPSGEITTYDKRHTFTLAGEDKVYQSGTHKVIIDYKGWKLCPLICYDLRFPVWARNTEAYDVLIYVANWPKVRVHAWDTLLTARAIENMSYTIGVNRVGLDANAHEYSGHSAVYDVLGAAMTNIPENKEAVAICTLEKSHIETYRNKLQFLNDKDEFTLSIN